MGWISLRALVKSIATLMLVAAIIGLGILGCGSRGSGASSNGSNPTPSNGSNPAPEIANLNQSCAPAGAQGFTLVVFGSNFSSSSVVRWNGSDRPTGAFASGAPELLSAQIPASDLAAPGEAFITVFTPPPGAGSSNSEPFLITPGGVNPQSVTLDPSGRFVYVANYGCSLQNPGNVSMYTTNSNGTLASIAGPVTADFGSRAVVVHPSGKFAYVANDAFGFAGCGPGSVSMYAINATTGGLTSMGTIDAGCGADSIATAPSGKYAYVANACEGDVSMYSIDTTTGALTSLGPIAAGGATSVTVDPTGKFVYVAGSGVSIFSVSATGPLTSVGVVAAGAGPTSVAIDPTGKFAYVANLRSNDVSMYSIDTTMGNLTSMGSISAGTGPISVTVDPTGKFVYVANSFSKNVSMFTINATTGVLTSIGTVAAGSYPTSIAVHPSGQFAYVTDGISVLGNPGSNNVSIYSIDATTGVLTLMGTTGT